MNFRQVSIIKDDSKYIIWLDAGKIKVGSWVKPKGYYDYWKVETIYPLDIFGVIRK